MRKTRTHISTASRHGTAFRSLVALAVVAMVVYAFDRVSKIFVVQDFSVGVPVDVVGKLLQFRFVENPGAAFSLGSGTTWIFAIIAAAVVVFIVIVARRIRSFGWAVLFGMLLGGTLGNLTDRLTRPPGFGVGHVVDFIQVYGFPAIFNLADVAIVSSMILFIALSLRGTRLDGSRSTSDRAGSETAAGALPDPAASLGTEFDSRGRGYSGDEASDVGRPDAGSSAAESAARRGAESDS